MTALTTGAIAAMCAKQTGDVRTEKITLQVISIIGLPGDKELKVLMCDGNNYIDSRIPFPSAVEVNSVMTLNQYTCRKIGTQWLLRVSEFDLEPSFPKVRIGKNLTSISKGANVTVFKEDAPTLGERPAAASSASTVAASATTPAEFKAPPPGRIDTTPSTTTGAGSVTTALNYTKITGLTVDAHTYRGKVMLLNVFNRTPDKQFYSGNGHKFQADMRDLDGNEIRATFFNDEATTWDDRIIIGNNYLITNFNIKRKDPKWNTLKGDLEMNVNRSTMFVETKEEFKAAAPTFDFIKISDLSEYKKGESVEVAGVVISCGDSRVNSKEGGNTTCRREMVIADDSNHCIYITLWGEKNVMMSEPHDVMYKVVAVRGKLSYFNEKVSINCDNIFIDIDDGGLDPLREWFEKNRAERHALMNTCVKINTLSGLDAEALLSGDKKNAKQIAEMKKTMTIETPKNYSVLLATISGFDIEAKGRSWYYACCPNAGANCVRRLDQNGNCSGCKQKYSSGIPRYTVQMELSDNSGGLNCYIVGDMAEKLLGISAEKMLAAEIESGKPMTNATFGASIKGKSYHFKVETYTYPSGVNRDPVFRCEVKGAVPAVVSPSK
jgi:hypothetical protein